MSVDFTHCMNPFLGWQVLSPACLSGISHICLSLEEAFFLCKLRLPVSELSHAVCYKQVLSVSDFMGILFIGCSLLWCLCCKARSGNGEDSHPKEPVLGSRVFWPFWGGGLKSSRVSWGFSSTCASTWNAQLESSPSDLKGAVHLGKGEGLLELYDSSVCLGLP